MCVYARECDCSGLKTRHLAGQVNNMADGSCALTCVQVMFAWYDSMTATDRIDKMPCLLGGITATRVMQVQDQTIFKMTRQFESSREFRAYAGHHHVRHLRTHIHATARAYNHIHTSTHNPHARAQSI
jgi:hypothetical protein